MDDFSGYDLSRNFWDWSFSNPEKIKPIHSAIYFFAVEHCNRLGWKDKFGFPSQMVMEAIGVKNWRTYSAGLKDLVGFGFIKMVETSKNQYSSNIIAIVNFTKAHTKALDKALSKHHTKHSRGTVSINKQLNKEPENNKQIFNFRKSLIENGFDEILVDDWLKVRKTKKATNSQTALNMFLKEVEKSGIDKNEILKICIKKDWKGFDNKWLVNLNEKEKSSAKKEKVNAGEIIQKVIMENNGII